MDNWYKRNLSLVHVHCTICTSIRFDNKKRKRTFVCILVAGKLNVCMFAHICTTILHKNFVYAFQRRTHHAHHDHQNFFHYFASMAFYRIQIRILYAHNILKKKKLRWFKDWFHWLKNMKIVLELALEKKREKESEQCEQKT